MNPSNSSQQQAQQPPRLVPIAPAASVTASTTQQNGADDEPHMQFTCVTCARRKVKCDKTGPPCSTCRKARQECYYQEPPPRKRKRKPVDELQDRVEKYEKLLQQHGIVPPAETENSPSEPSPGTGPAMNSKPPKPKSTGTLLKGAGKTRYIDSNIWRSLGEDLHPSSDEEESYQHHTPMTTNAEVLDPVSAAFLGQGAHSQSLIDLHPTYDVAMKLWKLYVKNVDPVIKLVHTNSTLEMLQRCAANPSGMSKVNECLLFAIYHFAISSCASEKESEALFGPQWALMKKKYHDATRRALVAVHFLRTTELAVLQAYMLLLLCVRNELDPHTFWILTGIAVRIAQRMGLHRDGEDLGLSPFDVQIRRRVFWQLLPLDGMSGQLSGTGIAIASDSWDTRQPLNLNDEDIWPGMEHTPEEKKGPTSMIFVLARTEIGKFHQKIRPGAVPGNWASWAPSDLPMIQRALRELENDMEEKYVRYCDLSVPTQVLCVAMARGAISSARLRVLRPRAKSHEDLTRSERKEIYEMAERVLAHDVAVHQNSALDGFRWHMRQFFQWDPLLTILQEARQQDCIIDPETLWTRIEQLYSMHEELFEQKRSFDVALNRMTVKSWDTVQANNIYPRSEPEFITRLRRGLGRREASRQTTETPKQQHNPFDPSLDTFDIGTSSHQANNSFMNYNPLFGYDFSQVAPMDNNMMNADMEWMFWNSMLTQNSGEMLSGQPMTN